MGLVGGQWEGLYSVTPERTGIQRSGELRDAIISWQIFWPGGHQAGPFFIEIDEILGDLLAFTRVGVQQRWGRVAGEHLTDLPTQVEAVLNRDVHALPGFCRVGVAGVAGDEDTQVWVASGLQSDVIEFVGHDCQPRRPTTRRHLDLSLVCRCEIFDGSRS